MRKKTCTILLVLAGASSASAGDSRDGGGGGKEPSMTLDELMKTKAVEKILIEDFPPIDTVDPGPQCKTIDAGKTFSIPLYEHGVGGNDISVTGNARAGLVANNNEIGFHAEVAPSVKLAGIKDMLQPFEVTLDAVTRSNGESALIVGVEAFGYTLIDKVIASTTAPLSEWVPVSWTLPDPGAYQGNWHWGFSCEDDNCSGDLDLAWAAVAEIVGWFDIGANATDGVTVKTGGHVVAYAAAHATARASVAGVDLDPVHANGEIDLVRLIFAARGSVAPWHNRWLADAAAVLTLDDTLGGYLRVSWNVPWWIDWLPGIPDYVYYTVFSLTPFDFWDEWKYQCTLDKPF